MFIKNRLLKRFIEMGIVINESDYNALPEWIWSKVLCNIRLFYKVFPETTGIINQIDLSADEEVFASIGWRSDATGLILNLNPVKFKNEWIETSIRMMREYKISFFKGLDSIIYHELGHALEASYIIQTSEIEEYENKWNECTESKKILEGIIPDDINYIANNVTAYATTDSSECFAELIAEIMTSRKIRVPAKKLKEKLGK